MRTVSIVGKSILLATIIFWLFFYNDIQSDNFSLILFSFIPISICVCITLFTTIYPWFVISKRDSKTVFNRIFPVYSILLFTICISMILLNNYENFTTSFLISAYITTCYAWCCFSKSDEV